MVGEKLTVTVEEAGELLGISRGLAYELVRRGELPSLHLGRRIVVPVHRLRAMLDGDGARKPAERSDLEGPNVPGGRGRAA